MLHFPSLIAQNERPAVVNQIVFQGFKQGLNTTVPPQQLQMDELAECSDWKIKESGQLETREAIVQHSTVAATGKIVAITSAIVGGVEQTIIADDDNKVYYLDGTEITLIGTATGDVSLFAYNDACMVCDGSYLKYVKDVSSLSLAYDAGTGGTQFDNYAGTDDSGIKIGDGTNIRAAAVFTTETWDTGFTIPPTQISVFLQRTGSPTGTVTVNIRKVSDDTIIATNTVPGDAENISTSGEFLDIYFIDDDVTTEFETETAYYASIEYAGGDASNYLELRCSVNGDFTNTGGHYVASWVGDTDCNPIIKVFPGIPPKCKFGWVSKSRPWFSGDPDNPGYVWYGALSYLDFSTGAHGGYISVIDEDRNSYPVGAGQDLYGDMFIFGTQAQPYISMLRGSSPADFSLPLMFQKGWATHKTIQNTGNDLWTASQTGVDTITGVQQYGDVRSTSISEKIKDRFDEEWDSTTAFAGYYPADGQYWLKLTNKLLIGHTKRPYPLSSGTTFPWTEYTLPFTATAFGETADQFMMGADDGHLYRFDNTEYKDLTTQIIPSAFRTAYLEMPFHTIDLIEIQTMASSEGGAFMEIAIYKNGNALDSVRDYPLYLPMRDDITLDELTMDIDDLMGAIDPVTTYPYFNLNINVFGFQVEYKSTRRVRPTLFFNGCVMKYRKLEKV